MIDATNIISNSDKGSPGIAGNTITDPDVNLSPTSGDLIISEIILAQIQMMYQMLNGNYFEIFNNTASTIALDD
ncbi:MAG: hypothetical protein U5K00_20520 [Melioribacteraceae bacterium]|nr:hypothetical protein [Melioribacteraceae bacterium]